MLKDNDRIRILNNTPPPNLGIVYVEGVGLCEWDETSGNYTVVAEKKAPGYIDWSGKAVGELFMLWSNWPIELPPTNNSNFRFVKLTASDSYNSGIFINETLTGTYPNINASAEINLPGSPFHGTRVYLLNTMRDFIRPGGTNTRQGFLVQSHSHTASSSAAGNHNHNAWTGDAGNHSHQFWAARNGGSHYNLTTGGDFSIDRLLDTGWAGTHSHAVGVDTQGNHTHTITVNVNGGEETRPNNVGADVFLRIY